MVRAPNSVCIQVQLLVQYCFKNATKWVDFIKQNKQKRTTINNRYYVSRNY